MSRNNSHPDFYLDLAGNVLNIYVQGYSHNISDAMGVYVILSTLYAAHNHYMTLFVILSVCTPSICKVALTMTGVEFCHKMTLYKNISLLALAFMPYPRYYTVSVFWRKVGGIFIHASVYVMQYSSWH